MQGQAVAIMFMAIALGMDAFSIGIGIGMRGIRLLHILKISMVVAVFHLVMPLIGMFTGTYLGSLLGDIAVFTGGGLLALLGLHMMYSACTKQQIYSFDHRSWLGIMLFSIGVSIDSFSVGISLGIFAADILFTVLLFGIVGGIMSIGGLILGRKMTSWLGKYGEACGGMILFIFGLKVLM
ncbi:manganese efflux pump MntP [Longirhabdus pacifica]|uniref:manganese efflux pump MntP n=1 Tax=Longirhabdus pacifica TaxID=2305227 RepID=UPI0010091A1B|nr:manganese efflux pump [Longirhabdus pacifica]